MDVMAAIQNVLGKRFKMLTENGMSNKEAYLRVYAEFERGVAESMREQARLMYMEECRAMKEPR